MTRTHIPVSNGTLVVSQGESAYQQVLDEFPNADRITVVTFNITPKNSALLDSLSSASCKATLICNIPKRFPKYLGYTDQAVQARKDQARRQIEDYLTAMDPTRFDTVVESYFCFRNHAKVVMTERIAFVGSANFSDESQANWECGFITSDADAIAQLFAAVEQLKNDSIRYLGKPVNELIAPSIELRQCLSVIEAKLTEDCLDTLSGSLHDLKRAISAVDMPWAFAFESGGPLTSRIDMAILDQLESLVSNSAPIRDFAEFDPENIFSDEVLLEAYDDRLDRVIEAASNDAHFQLDELREQAETELSSLTNGLKKISEQVESAIKEITEAHDRIDNTKSKDGKK
jgi:hypothetical protein